MQIHYSGTTASEKHPEHEQLGSLISLACRPGKIAVDPTSDEDASVELNQSTQLGSTGTTGVNAYPKYADGTKVLPQQ